MIAASIFFLAALAPWHAQGQIRTRPPAEFLGLTEPQTTVVDIFFGDRAVGEAEATFAPGSIAFTDADAVVALVPGIIPERREAVVAALSGRQRSNGERSCLPVRFPGCGTLEVGVAGVIFSVDFLRADIVIAPGFLSTQALAGKYLADPTTGPSFISNLTAGAAGSTDSGGDAVVIARSRLSSGRYALRSDLIAQRDDNRPVVDVLAGEYHGRDHFAQSGIIEDRGTRFGRVPLVLGGEVETSLRSRLDTELLTGSPVFLFLPQRSQVEVYRDDRLLDARVYEAGNQQIDTSRLPNGSYEIEMRIRGSSGDVRTERVIFTKDLNFPPPGEPQYFAELGMVVDDDEGDIFPKVEQTPIAKAGIAMRLADALAGAVSLSGTDQVALGEASLRLIRSIYTGGAAVGMTSRGGLGVALDLGANWGSFGIGVSGQVDQGGRDLSDNELFRPLEKRRTSASGTASYGLDDGSTIGFRAYFREDDDSRTYGFGPRYTRPLYRGRDWNVDLDSEATFANDEQLVLARVRFSYNVPERPVRIDGSAGVRWRTVDQDDEDEGFGGFGNLGARYAFENYLGGNGDLFVEAGRDVDATNRVSAGGRLLSAYGSLDASADLEDERGDRDALYRGAVGTTIAANGDGIAWGGYQRGDAAILAKFDGAPGAGRVSVSAGSGNSEVFVDSGSSVVLPVGPYRRYDPRAGSGDERLLDIRQTLGEVTLYPGNVATARWKVVRKFAIYGRIVGTDGAPLSNARIRGIEGFAGTDLRGNFVVELEQSGNFEVVSADGQARCNIELLIGSGEQDVVSAGDVPCR